MFGSRDLLCVAALAAVTPLTAQGCLAIPADTPGFGAPSATPFGNNNATDPVFSDTRYQLLVPTGDALVVRSNRSRHLTSPLSQSQHIALPLSMMANR